MKMAQLLPPTFPEMEFDTTANPKETIAVLMSGGVDSSVTAHLLKTAGFKVVGITMNVPMPDCVEGENLCCGGRAAIVAKGLGIPHYFVEIKEEFNSLVLEPFRNSYRTGLTPSPCIDCNSSLKFRFIPQLLKKSLGIERIATGHYVRIEEDDTGFHLYPAIDQKRDQSYFLYSTDKDILPRLRFPLGTWKKEDVRRLADELKMPIADRPDSMELCFAGEGDYRQALGKNPDHGPGDVVDTCGEIMGTHNGISHYTIGQRKGLGIALGRPIYVVDIDSSANRVVVGDKEHLLSKRGRVHRLNILEPDLVKRERQFTGKIRSQHDGSPCVVEEVAEDEIVVSFDLPQEAVTPGQHLVLYSDDGRVAGGGVIKKD